MRKSLKLSSAPSVEPVTTAEAKSWLRVDTSTDDTMIDGLIETARVAVENYTKRALITQTWELRMDAPAVYSGLWFLSSLGAIDLPKLPIQSITSFKSYDDANTETTFSSASYSLHEDGGRLFLNDGYTWPTDLRPFASVLITYVCGYGDAATDVPEAYKTAIKMLVANMYNNRSDCEMTTTIKGMLAPYKLYDHLGG